MKLKTTPVTLLRKFTALLLSSAIICSSYIQLIACGGGEDESHYSLIPVEKASWDPYAPYFISGYSLFGRMDDPDLIVPSNLEAWESYFKLRDRQAVISLIFTSEEVSLLQLIQAIKEKKSLPEVWQQNTLAVQLAKNPKAPVLDYLSFSKRSEKHFTHGGSDWWEDLPAKDSIGMLQRIQEGESLHKKTKDKELKNRYSYQLLRLHFYLGDYSGVNTIYEKTLEPANWNNKLKYQALNYDFGASWQLAHQKEIVTKEEKAQLILKLSKTFQKCEDCALLHYEDLHYFQAADFFQASVVLKDPQDKIDLWMLGSLRSIPRHVAIDKILEIDPNAPELHSLMDNLLEHSQSARFKRSESTLTDYFATEEWNQIQFVMKKASLNKKAEDRAQYAFLLAYFDYISGKYHKSREELENSALLPGAENLIIIQQQRVLRSLLDLETWNMHNLTNSHLLVGHLNELMAINHKDLSDYSFRRFEELANNSGQMVLEGLLFASMYRSIESDLSYPDLLMLEESFLKNEKNVVERWVWKHHPISLNQIHEWKGDALLAMHRFDEATLSYQAAGRSNTLITNPFIIHLVDCHDCDHLSHPGTLNRLQFCEKMSNLNQQAQKGDAKAAFEYANGLYNITWFGNSRDAMNHNLKGDQQSDHSNYFSMDAVSAAYQLAFKLAADKEKKARLLFMLAKCEQNTYDTEGENVSYQSFYGEDQVCDPVKNQEYRKNFKLLKTKYNQTSFYKLALKECTYFEHFVRVH